MKENVLIILLSIIALCCNFKDDKSEKVNDDNLEVVNDDNLEKVNIESTLIAKGNLHGDRAEGIVEQNLVISDQATWNSLITQMNSVNNVSDRFSATDIDFSKYKIIAIFDGIRGNDRYSLELDIMANSDSVIVDVKHLAREGEASEEITQPFHIVKIANSDLPIIFK